MLCHRMTARPLTAANTSPEPPLLYVINGPVQLLARFCPCCVSGGSATANLCGQRQLWPFLAVVPSESREPSLYWRGELSTPSHPSGEVQVARTTAMGYHILCGGRMPSHSSSGVEGPLTWHPASYANCSTGLGYQSLGCTVLAVGRLCEELWADVTQLYSGIAGHRKAQGQLQLPPACTAGAVLITRCIMVA